ncbi:MbcA/ParS/Xre antitoxin family protein [Caballeronia sp. ATUFL_F2_KS9A]|uniref:MbcA/ParS/Xre antitoxin family protein n=1 Tax=Caballeronia sp. ATUFL_F2_KS9A TaxID=2921777 RepID=UPI002029668E|nr:MbcA/ParS/Xre antitoxin family protein [Caballeronia sp. ATUFL_F2_KS9A]
MISSDFNPLEPLTADAARLYADLEDTGRRAMEALRTIDPVVSEELFATFESEDRAARWLISRTIGFGGRSALELLSQGDREEVMHVLHHLRYGFCA